MWPISTINRTILFFEVFLYGLGRLQTQPTATGRLANSPQVAIGPLCNLTFACKAKSLEVLVRILRSLFFDPTTGRRSAVGLAGILTKDEKGKEKGNQLGNAKAREHS